MTTTAPTLRDLAMQHNRDACMATASTITERMSSMEAMAGNTLTTLLSTISNGHLTNGTITIEREPHGIHALVSRVRLAVPGDDLVLWQEMQAYDGPGGPDAYVIEPVGSVPCPHCKHVYVHEVSGLADLYELYTLAAQCCGR